ncbi:LysR family transcriptional regulator [Amycolatopsis sp. cg5]|uniref:LysR family transcriptional regulator n=1 Tax=Amycolatopsis sp. cg5 TaxID=3238802 RepID=UPI0035261022
MHLDFRHLELLVAIAEAGTLRRAAAELHLSQPAVTTQLKRIEHHIGGPLFLRSPDGVVPTQLGAGVIEHARKVLVEFSELERRAQLNAQRDAEYAPIRVGGIPANQFWLLVSALGDAFPDREITSRTVKSTAMLTTLLGSGELDVAVMRQFPRFPLRLPESVVQAKLLIEPIFVGVGLDHQLADRGEIGLGELADETWVMPEPDDSGMNEFFSTVCADNGFEQRVAHLTNDSHIAFALTAAGAVCPLYPIGFSPRQGLATIPLAGNPFYRELVLAWRTDSLIAPQIGRLRERVGQGYLELVGDTPVYSAWWERGGSAFALP